MSDERLRELDRAHRADPQDLRALRKLADERKRRGIELLPDRRRAQPWHWLEWIDAAFRLAIESGGEPVIYSANGELCVAISRRIAERGLRAEFAQALEGIGARRWNELVERVFSRSVSLPDEAVELGDLGIRKWALE